MKKTTLLIVASVFFLLSSCIPSLHSIVKEDNRVTDDRLIGNWKMEEETFKESWTFERMAKLKFKYEKLPAGVVDWEASAIGGAASSLKNIRKQYKNEAIIISEKELLPYYLLRYKDDTGNPVIEMKVELTKIGEDLYMDFFPKNSSNGDSRFATSLIRAHTFAKVNFTGKTLSIQSFNLEKIESLIKSKRIRLKHEIIKTTVELINKFREKEDIILTASTDELRAFILKYGNKEDLFEDAEALIASDE